MPNPEDEIVTLTEKLLDSIATADWTAYSELCDTSLTCFEPEAHGQLVAGLPFHRFFFKLGGARTPHCTTICSPRVRMLGPDAAVITYVRLNERVDAENRPGISAVEETRIWQRLPNGNSGPKWKHVHFHRSFPGK
jgi:calcium/calmodulin-dependent protein kinase (CaM kinase) II